MTFPTPAKMNTAVLHLEGAICTCCRLHPAAPQPSAVQPSPNRILIRQTTNTANTSPEKTSSSDDPKVELCCFLFFFASFMVLGIWLTYTERIGHVKWKLGVGITSIVLTVYVVVIGFCSSDCAERTRKLEAGEEDSCKAVKSDEA